MLCPAGSIFTPGAGGTVQQSFSKPASDRAAVPGEHPGTERARPVSILTESGHRIAPPRLRRPALRSAAGEWQCSYTPAPLRSLYGLVARPALSCLSDSTQSGSNNRNGQSNNRNPAFDNTRSGNRGQTRKRIRIYSPGAGAAGERERSQRNFASAKGSI